MMTNDEVERLRAYLLHAHDDEVETGLFHGIVLRIKARFQRTLKQPKPIVLRSATPGKGMGQASSR